MVGSRSRGTGDDVDGAGVNPADQIEAIVARAVTTLRSVEQRHRAMRDAAVGDWRDPVVDDIDDRDREDAAEADGPVLGPTEIAALSDAAGA